MEEIKAWDIMIGNYLLANDNEIHKVSKFDEHTVWFEKTVNKHGVPCWLISEITECSPITLTEDILLKAGAKRIEENKVSIMLNDPSTHSVLMKVGTHWYPTIEQVDELGEIRIVFLSYIDHLHQAQNLFKSLTGNDLKIEV